MATLATYIYIYIYTHVFGGSRFSSLYANLYWCFFLPGNSKWQPERGSDFSFACTAYVSM